MPNHTSSDLTITGPAEIIRKIVATHFREDDGKSEFDFNTIIPMPEELRHTTSGSNRSWGIELLNARGKKLPSELTVAKHVLEKAGIDSSQYDQYTIDDVIGVALDVDPNLIHEGLSGIRCLELYGCKDWYDWAVEEWGTKWGAYDVFYEVHPNDESLTVRFNTAWSPATPVIQKMAEMYPDVSMEYNYLDEGGGFAGTEAYRNGRLITYAEHDWRDFAENHFGLEFCED